MALSIGGTRSTQPPVIQPNAGHLSDPTLMLEANDANVYTVLKNPVLYRETRPLSAFIDTPGPSSSTPSSASNVILAPGDDTAQRCWMLVTSPNSDQIYEPVIGIRELRAREDGRCGLEDYSQHPQIVIPGHEYLTCVARNPPAALKQTPTLADCPKLEGSAFDFDLRMLNQTFVKPMMEQYFRLETAVEDHLVHHPTHTKAAALGILMRQTMKKLKITQTFPEILVAVAEFQRAALFTGAFIFYFGNIWPRVHRSPGVIHPVNAGLMGGFTESLEVADNLFHAGIPVWFLQPAFRITSTTLLRRCVSITPSAVVTADAVPRFKTVYTGPPSLTAVDWLQRVNHQLLDIIQRPSFIETPQVFDQPSPSSTAHATGPIRRATSSSSSSPYHLPPSHQLTAPAPIRNTHSSPSSSQHMPSRNVATPMRPFLPSRPWSSTRRTSSKSTRPVVPPGPKCITPEGPSHPPMVPSWKAAILAIVDKKGIHDKPPHKIGFTVPPLRLFTETKHPTHFIATWMACRAAYLPKTTEIALRYLTKDHWRLFLNLVRHQFLGAPQVPPPPAEGESSSRRNYRSASTVARAQSTYLDTLAQHLQTIKVLKWPEEEYAVTPEMTLPDTVIAEVEWDANEMATRFDMAYCDQAMVPQKWMGTKADEHQTHADIREDLLCEVFAREPDDTPGWFTLPAIPIQDGGLASSEIGERLRALLAFREIVKSWPGCPPSIVNATVGAGAEEVDAFDRELACYYTQTFFDNFGRPPAVPHHLPLHVLSRSYPRWFSESTPSPS